VLWRELAARRVVAKRPFVGNATHLLFESPTDVPEDTVLDGR
jgi:hypothetical protein